MIERYELKQRQSLPLEAKIQFSKNKIREFVARQDNNCALSLSGKDSLVIYYLLKEMGLNLESVYCNTGLEHPEIVKFNRSLPNVEVIRPEVNFQKIWKEKGIPFPSKKVARMLWNLQNPTSKNQAVRNLNLTGYNRKGVLCPTHKLPKKWHCLIDCPYRFGSWCCNYLKEIPLNKWYKSKGFYPIMGILASESNDREKRYLKEGCNVYEGKIRSNPISIWTEQDILRFFYEKKYPYSKAYGEIIKKEDGTFYNTGEPRTGCMACLFGIQFEKEPNRIQRLAVYQPAFYNYLIKEFNYDKILEMVGIPYKPVLPLPKPEVDIMSQQTANNMHEVSGNSSQS